MKKEKLIAFTYGDPCGIGPEILLNTLKSFKKSGIIFGLKSVLSKSSKFNKHFKNVSFIEPDNFQNLTFKHGKPCKESGEHAYNCLLTAIHYLKRNKNIKALVTGPVSKKIISLSRHFKGQTDAMAKMCSKKNVIMIFIASDLRIALFSRHIPLKDVHGKITRKKLRNYIFLLRKELQKWFHIKNPKIAVLGLNPHAGEDGLIGNEEVKIIKPVINEICRDGVSPSPLHIYGPLSPDATLARAGQDYLKGKKQKYDAYISFYHDQSLPMFKAVCGFRGLNVTLGLPFIRVSPDHGTAFDIAGKNKADSSGMIEAVRFLDEIL